jgi:hypothetical protein
MSTTTPASLLTSGQLAGAQATAAALHLIGDQQRQQYDEDTDENVVVSGKFNQVSNHRRRFQGVKMSASIHSHQGGPNPVRR